MVLLFPRQSPDASFGFQVGVNAPPCFEEALQLLARLSGNMEVSREARMKVVLSTRALDSCFILVVFRDHMWWSEPPPVNPLVRKALTSSQYFMHAFDHHQNANKLSLCTVMVVGGLE